MNNRKVKSVAAKSLSLLRGGLRGCQVESLPGHSILLPRIAHRSVRIGLSQAERLFRFLLDGLDDDKSFIDIGANIGAYCATLNSHLRHKLTAIAF